MYHSGVCYEVSRCNQLPLLIYTTRYRGIFRLNRSKFAPCLPIIFQALHVSAIVNMTQRRDLFYLFIKLPSTDYCTYFGFQPVTVSLQNSPLLVQLLHLASQLLQFNLHKDKYRNKFIPKYRLNFDIIPPQVVSFFSSEYCNVYYYKQRYSKSHWCNS